MTKTCSGAHHIYCCAHRLQNVGSILNAEQAFAPVQTFIKSFCASFAGKRLVRRRRLLLEHIPGLKLSWSSTRWSTWHDLIGSFLKNWNAIPSAIERVLSETKSSNLAKLKEQLGSVLPLMYAQYCVGQEVWISIDRAEMEGNLTWVFNVVQTLCGKLTAMKNGEFGEYTKQLQLFTMTKLAQTTSKKLLDKLNGMLSDFTFVKEVRVIDPAQRHGLSSHLESYSHIFTLSEKQHLQESGEWAVYFQSQQDSPTAHSNQCALRQWWKAKQQEFPYLAVLAGQLLAVRAHTQIVEASFSRITHLSANHHRRRLLMSSKADYVNVQSNLQIFDRLPAIPNEGVSSPQPQRRRRHRYELPCNWAPSGIAARIPVSTSESDSSGSSGSSGSDSDSSVSTD